MCLRHIKSLVLHSSWEVLNFYVHWQIYSLRALLDNIFCVTIIHKPAYFLT